MPQKTLRTKYHFQVWLNQLSHLQQAMSLQKPRFRQKDCLPQVDVETICDDEKEPIIKARVTFSIVPKVTQFKARVTFRCQPLEHQFTDTPLFPSSKSNPVCNTQISYLAFHFIKCNHERQSIPRVVNCLCLGGEMDVAMTWLKG